MLSKSHFWKGKYTSWYPSVLVSSDLSPLYKTTCTINQYLCNILKPLKTTHLYVSEQSYKPSPFPHFWALFASIQPSCHNEGGGIPRWDEPEVPWLGVRDQKGPHAYTQLWFSGLGEIRLGEGRESRAVPISLWVFYDGKIKHMLMVEMPLLPSPLTPGESSCKTGFLMYVLRCGFGRNPPPLESETSAVT